jgi:hypothetical protein
MPLRRYNALAIFSAPSVSQFRELLVRLLKPRDLPGHSFEALDDHIDIERIKFDTPADAASSAARIAARTLWESGFRSRNRRSYRAGRRLDAPIRLDPFR